MSDGSTVIVQQDGACAYPNGLRRLPELLERIDNVRYELSEIGTQASELAASAEGLDQELCELAQFTQTRVEINRARERRRVRHHRNGDSSNGHVPYAFVTATN